MQAEGENKSVPFVFPTPMSQRAFMSSIVRIQMGHLDVIDVRPDLQWRQADALSPLVHLVPLRDRPEFRSIASLHGRHPVPLRLARVLENPVRQFCVDGRLRLTSGHFRFD